LGPRAGQKLLVSFLRQRGGHAVGHVQAGQGPDLVDPTGRSLRQSIPDLAAQKGKLHVAPRRHGLGHVVQVGGCTETPGFLPVRSDDPGRPVIKVHPVLAVHQTHVIGPDLVGLGPDHLPVTPVFENQSLEETQGKDGKVHLGRGNLPHPLPLQGRQSLGDAAGQGPGRVGGLAP